MAIFNRPEGIYTIIYTFHRVGGILVYLPPKQKSARHWGCFFWKSLEMPPTYLAEYPYKMSPHQPMVVPPILGC
jgi:hypothetical protein